MFSRRFCVCLLNLHMLLAVSFAGRNTRTACGEKQKTLALLDIAENSLSKADFLYPTCSSNSISSNLTDTEKKEKAQAYLDITKKLIAEVRETFQTCGKTLICPNRPTDCSEILENGNTRSGVYTIWPTTGSPTEKPLEVYCDMETDGGGWTVIQRRGNFTQQQSFQLDYESYKKGFGNITRDFWLGNDNLFDLSNQAQNKIRFDLQNVKGDHRFAVYNTFWIDDQYSSYTLHIGDYQGTAGDAMKNSDGAVFSTEDQGHMNFARSLKGGWWYSAAANCNPNGIYQFGKFDPENVHWFTWLEWEGLVTVEIKLRRK